MLNDVGNPYMHNASTLCDNNNAVIRPHKLVY